MPVHVLISYDVTDSDVYQGYISSVVPLLQKHGAQIPAADTGGIPLEGARGACTWFCGSPPKRLLGHGTTTRNYQQIRRIRLRSTTNGSIVVLHEFVSPTA